MSLKSLPRSRSESFSRKAGKEAFQKQQQQQHQQISPNIRPVEEGGEEK